MDEIEISKKITLYIKGNLDEEEEDRLWVEFLRNPAHFREFETELNLYDLFRNKNYRINPPAPQAEEPTVNYGRWIFSIAAIVLLTIGSYFIFELNSDISSYAISDIEVKEMLGADIYRDAQNGTEEAERSINRSLATALEGNETGAYIILEELDEESLDGLQRAKVQFNQGILMYNAGNYQRASHYFSELFDNSQLPAHMRDKALWYKAHTQLKLQNTAEARETLSQLVSQGVNYTEQANQLLEKLEDH